VQQEQIIQIPLDHIVPSDGNRRVGGFDQGKLEQLADSIRTVGVQQPAVVRFNPATGEDLYELVAGERRWRAARLAGLETLPCVVRELTDAQLLRIQVIENLQREDVHPLDEAEGFRRLVDVGSYDATLVAKEVGRSEGYVHQRMRLLHLEHKPRCALIDGKIGVSHAMLIARLPGPLQDQALQACLRYTGDPVTVRELDDWIRRHIYLSLSAAAFKPSEKGLVPAIGACTDCTKRTGYAPALFPEIGAQDFCLDGKCYAGKVAAQVERRRQELAGEPHVEISTDYSERKEGVLGPWQYSECKKKVEGAERALVVSGPDAGRLTWVTRTQQGAGHQNESQEERDARIAAARADTVARNAREILAEKLMEWIAAGYRAQPRAHRWDEDLLRMACAQLIEERYDIEDILTRYKVNEGVHELQGEELGAKLAAMEADELEMLLIEILIAPESPPAWQPLSEPPWMRFLEFARRRGVDVGRLQAEALKEAEESWEAAKAQQGGEEEEEDEPYGPEDNDPPIDDPVEEEGEDAGGGGEEDGAGAGGPGAHPSERGGGR
jgi:ParB/RepB/Spo0J family partition protein